MEKDVLLARAAQLAKDAKNEFDLDRAAELYDKAGDKAQADACRDRAGQMRALSAYAAAKHTMDEAKTAAGYETAAGMFMLLGDQFDAKALAKECHEKAAVQKKHDLFDEAKARLDHATAPDDAEAAARILAEIPDFEGVKELLDEAEQKRIALTEKTAQDEEALRIKKEKRIARKKRLIKIAIGLVAAAIVITGAYYLIRYELIPLTKYNRAKTLMTQGQYEEATDILREVHAFRDAEDILNHDEHIQAVIRRRMLENAKTVGATVHFGYFEQDRDRLNGAEEIEWLVLSYDEQKGQSVLLSLHTLHCMPYNKEYKEVSWADSTLRAYLTNEFLSAAFNDRERAALVAPDAEDALGDTVFLLSESELEQYLPNIDDRVVTATPYAESHQVIGYSNRFFLRSHGDWAGNAKVSSFNGLVLNAPVGNYRGVRPAIIFDLNAYDRAGN